MGLNVLHQSWQLYSYLYITAAVYTNWVFPKLITRVSHNGTFDALIETLETMSMHAQIEYFILTIRTPHDG